MSATDVETVVRRLRRRGYEAVSIDELHGLLLRRTRRTAKVVVFTFDDGYASVRHVAHPLLKALGVPYTLYLTTGFPDRTFVPWWYLLEDAIVERAGGELRVTEAEPPLPLTTHDQREAAFTTVSARFASASPAECRSMADALFGPDRVLAAFERLALSWDDVRYLAADPLTTIGAHTTTHPVLNALQADEALREMIDSRERIAERVGVRPAHFAYPYGSRLQVGEREYMLAEQAGFATAVTTRCANIFPGNSGHLRCLPRTYGGTPAEIERAVSGVVSAFSYRGRRVVTV